MVLFVLHEKKTVILLLFFAFFSVPSTTIAAVPCSRSLKPLTLATQIVSNPTHPYNHFQRKGRMDMEIADYSETGANNHHDPIPPGSS
ncbi:hypothetical protein ACJIZ3_010051 [Penstemon smallii]|uniref:Transmembrane protein n=1 Tax=Penstemon smallii TaxID=265156 RepID=A0ABD3TFS6_9LAMI